MELLSEPYPSDSSFKDYLFLEYYVFRTVPNHFLRRAIRSGFHYLLTNYPEVFVIGQGLWSPWYVGNSMTNLDKELELVVSLIPPFLNLLVLALL